MMTCEEDYSIPEEILEQICEDGFDAPPDLIRIMGLEASQGREMESYWKCSSAMRNTLEEGGKS